LKRLSRVLIWYVYLNKLGTVINGDPEDMCGRSHRTRPQNLGVPKYIYSTYNVLDDKILFEELKVSKEILILYLYYL
jgi:hypothetical protein